MYNQATYKKELNMLYKAKNQLIKISHYQMDAYEGSTDPHTNDAITSLEKSIEALQELIGETE